MIANYHAHTWRCMHASGTEREYVEKAIEGGLKIFGFSDHTPMPYPGGYESRVKMRMDQLEGYVDTVLSLKKEYAGDIEIHLGLEVEYYPQLFEKLVSFTQQYPIEYYLLGQHHLGNEIGEPFCGNPMDDPAALQRYCSQCVEALETGSFTYFAHPDVFHFTGDPLFYEEQMRWLCRETKRLAIPLEINFLGIRDHRHYPNEIFWRIAGETGNKAVFGADAHSPGAVWNPEALKSARDIAARYRLEVLDTVEMADPAGSSRKTEAEGPDTEESDMKGYDRKKSGRGLV